MALSGDDEIAGACELLDQAANAIESLREVSDAFDGMAEQAEEVRCWRQICATAWQVRGTIWTFLRRSVRWSSSAWTKSTV